MQVLLDGRKSNSAQIVNGYIDSIISQLRPPIVDLGGGAARSQRDRRPLLVQPQPGVSKRDGAGPVSPRSP